MCLVISAHRPDVASWTDASAHHYVWTIVDAPVPGLHCTLHPSGESILLCLLISYMVQYMYDTLCLGQLVAVLSLKMTLPPLAFAVRVLDISGSDRV